MLKIDNVRYKGASGQFRSSQEHIGWRDLNGQHHVIYDTKAVRRAEWFEGQLRVQFELQADSEQDSQLRLEGFPAEKFDDIWRFFEQNCGVYVKKHKPVAAIDEADFDKAMRAIEDAADRVDAAAKQSVQKSAREADLMKKVEAVRDGLDQAVAGDKQALSRVFSANGCERIGRMRLVLDTVQLEGAFRQDPRWKHLRDKAAAIEAVLKELGTFSVWKPSQEDEGQASMVRRQHMIAELRRLQGDEDVISPEPLQPTPMREPVPTREPVPMRAAPVVTEQVESFASDEPPAYADRPSSPLPEFVPEAPRPQGNREEEQRADDTGRDRGTYLWRPHGGGYHDMHNEDASSTGGNRIRYTRSDSILEGLVWKRSRHLKRWRPRWLVLMPGYLASFKNRGDPEPTETIDAGQVHRVTNADFDVNQARSIGIVVQKRTYYIVCDSEDAKKEWMREIAKALGTKFS